MILDPRFGWGRPVIEENNVPLSAILDLWHAGEAMRTIADEFEMDRDEVERLIQDYDDPSRAQPPRFLADRCLGRVTIDRLRELGWDIVRLASFTTTTPRQRATKNS